MKMRPAATNEVTPKSTGRPFPPGTGRASGSSSAVVTASYRRQTSVINRTARRATSRPTPGWAGRIDRPKSHCPHRRGDRRALRASACGRSRAVVARCEYLSRPAISIYARTPSGAIDPLLGLGTARSPSRCSEAGSRKHDSVCAIIPDMSESGASSSPPLLVDTREHRFQLGVVGVSVLAFTVMRRPRMLVAVAVATAFPVLPTIYRRLLAPHLSAPTSMEDRRLPAFARLAGGAGLVGAATGASVAPSKVTYGALCGVGGVCLYGAVTGYCVPCSTLLLLEKLELVRLDPPLVCAVPPPRVSRPEGHPEACARGPDAVTIPYRIV